MGRTIDRVIHVDGLVKHFGSVHAVDGVSLSVGRGEVVALCGRSGSGKSTLLRCMNFLEVADEGTVEVDGIHIDLGHRVDRRQRDLMLRARRCTGMVFQEFNLFPHLTAIDNVSEGLATVKKLKKSDARSRASLYLEKVGLADKADSYPAHLSGGQQQRVAIARALAMEPVVMLFDEPTSALDPELIGEVLTVMEDLAGGGMTMVVVTHELTFARHAADRVAFMDEGLIIADGTPEEVIERPTDERLQRFVRALQRGEEDD